MTYDPNRNLVGGFSPNDGTIDFYLRINSIIKETDTVLDFGAGRAAWYEDDTCPVRKSIRLLKGKVSQVIAADIDEAVLDNRASDRQMIMDEGMLGLEPQSLDLIVAVYVLEHVADPALFTTQITYALKDGGWFCARTPHKASYVAIAASLIKNTQHSMFLKKIQPLRKEVDVFPTFYRMNTMKDIAVYFKGWKNHSFLFKGDPAYYFGSKRMYDLQHFAHRFIFKEMSGNLFIFVQKRGSSEVQSGS